MTGPAAITGMTLQVGGAPLISCAKGSADDRAWFERNPARRHRIRRPLGGERLLRKGMPRSAALMIVVRQVKPSARIRLEFGWRGPPLINAEQIAARSFELAAERSPRVADLEQTIRGDTAIRRITWEPAP